MTEENKATDTENIEKPLSKEEHIENYIKAMMAVEYQMEPLREHKKDLRKNYKENQWLDADDFKNITKVLSIIKSGIELEDLEEYIKPVTKGFIAPIGKQKEDE